MQSFLPLSILVAIKNIKIEIWGSLVNFFRRLFEGDIAVLLEVYKHAHTWTFLLVLISIFVTVSGCIAIWQFREVQFSGFIDAL